MRNKIIGATIGIIGASIAWLYISNIYIPPATDEIPSADPVTGFDPALAPPSLDPVYEQGVNNASFPAHSQFGTSTNGHPLEQFTFGSGTTQVLLIGGIHGGYEWNTVLLAQQFVDYYTQHPEAVPETLSLTIIPAANPDGLNAVIDVSPDNSFTMADIAEDTAPGRFNGNQVDLNRNFDCNWQPEATWQNKTVAAGAAAFSEPETIALREMIMSHSPAVVVFWHSASDGVYASFCNDNILPQTSTLGKAYSTAAGYAWNEEYEYYTVTGDAADWLASEGIPALTVELHSHQSTEWDNNFAGVTALLQALTTED